MKEEQKTPDFQLHGPQGKQGPPGGGVIPPGPCDSSQRQSFLESPSTGPEA